MAIYKGARAMEEVEDTDDNEYNNEEIENIILETIDGILTDLKYEESKVHQWINDIWEEIMSKLNKLGKSYKYVWNWMISQKIEAGFHTAYTCVWENFNDGLTTVIWPKGRPKEASLKAIQCVWTVFCVRF